MFCLNLLLALYGATSLSLPDMGEDGLIPSIIAVESGFTADAVSPIGAKGLMQLTEIAVKDARRICEDIPNDPDLFNPDMNIYIGTCFLSLLKIQYEGNEELILAHYNGGGRQVRRIRKGKKPVKETSEYIKKVQDIKQRFTRKECI